MAPTRVVVHNTANDAPAANEIAYMIRNDNEVSFHYAVDDQEVVQGIPENRPVREGAAGTGGEEAVDALDHHVPPLPVHSIKKSFIGSGVRYDLLQYQSKDPAVNRSTAEYTRELIAHHVSGRLKVAPEHTSDQVLQIMRKPSFSQFYDFKKTFDKINKELNMRQQIIPYFISSHPGCTEEDMAELAVITNKLDFHLEQVQDFTPTPMTVATETWYTGYHPYTLQPVFSAKTPKEKLAQRMFFFW